MRLNWLAKVRKFYPVSILDLVIDVTTDLGCNPCLNVHTASRQLLHVEYGNAAV